MERKMLDMLACPKCHGDIEEKGMFLLCRKCSLAYPVLEGDIPDMLLEDAWNLSDAEKNGFKHDNSL
ncbi:MAG: Trm112 family protein [Candidatus Micrarchaeota archaeon]|nr:Trm112 family protein [Candidatus Micrarchaeota archaeon]